MQHQVLTLLGLGMDFYFVENVYLGLELGLGVHAYTYSDRVGVSTVTIGGSSTTTTLESAGYKESYLSTYSSLRLGWRF